MEKITLLQLMVSCIFSLSDLSSGHLAIAAPAQLVINFQPESYDVTPVDVDLIKNLASEVANDPKTILIIHEQTCGAKKSALDCIRKHNRTLRIFQTLVREGVDPARILVDEVNPQTIGAKDADRMAVDVRSDSQALSTKKLTVQPHQPTAVTSEDFTVNFPSASAEAVNLSQDKFKEFLSAVGQPGRDAVIIEGHTDSVGNAAYNKALGELRALTVYERLVRAGLPPYRVDTQSKGMSQAGKSDEPGKGSQADRKVIIRWTKNDQIATFAAQQEAPKAEPVKEEVPKQEITQPPAAPEVKAADDRTGHLDIVPLAGVFQPLGEWRSHARSALALGLGIGKALWSDETSEARLTIFGRSRATFPAKEGDRSGPVKIDMYDMRFDYAFGSSSQPRPFLGLGLGYYKWTGEIRQPSTGFINQGSGKDKGVILAAGWDVPVASRIFVTPQVSYHRVSGDLFESLLSLVAELRWRI